MSTPFLEFYADADLLTAIEFPSRPLGRTSETRTLQLWNDKSGENSAVTADVVFLLARRHESFTSTGAATLTLSAPASEIYEIYVDGEKHENFSHLTPGVITWTAGYVPEEGAVIAVTYEDESCTKQVLRVRSSGVVDPEATGIADDAQAESTGIGGTEYVEDEAVGTGDGSEVTFSLANPCIHALTVFLGGTPTTAYTLDEISGIIEFNTAPALDVVITATYHHYKVLQLGPIPPEAGRTIHVKAFAPPDAELTRADATLEVWAR